MLCKQAAEQMAVPAPNVADVRDRGEIIRGQRLQDHRRFSGRETAHRVVEDRSVARRLDDMGEDRAAEFPDKAVWSAIANDGTQVLPDGVMFRAFLQQRDAPQALGMIRPQEFTGSRERERAISIFAQKPRLARARNSR